MDEKRINFYCIVEKVRFDVDDSKIERSEFLVRCPNRKLVRIVVQGEENSYVKIAKRYSRLYIEGIKKNDKDNEEYVYVTRASLASQ